MKEKILHFVRVCSTVVLGLVSSAIVTWREVFILRFCGNIRHKKIEPVDRLEFILTC